MAEDNESEEESSEIPEYSPKSEFSKARLAETAVTNVLNSRGVEMKEGYFNTKLTKDGQAIKQWVPDARDKFFGSVIALMSLLSPEIARDKKIKIALEEFETGCDELKEKYLYEELIMYSENGMLKYKKTGNKYLPIIDEKVVIELFIQKKRQNKGEEVIGGWNNKVNSYKNDLVEVYDYLFSQLNNLIDRVNYFKSSASF